MLTKARRTGWYLAIIVACAGAACGDEDTVGLTGFFTRIYGVVDDGRVRLPDVWIVYHPGQSCSQTSFMADSVKTDAAGWYRFTIATLDVPECTKFVFRSRDASIAPDSVFRDVLPWAENAPGDSLRIDAHLNRR
jgi:hypothetical protein